MVNSETNYKNIGKNSIYIYFWLTFIIVLCFCCLIFNAENINPSYISISIGIYSIILFFYIFFTNLAITKTICKEENFNMAFMSSLIPFLFIYTLVMLMIYFFVPGWVRVFSNTFGLSIAKLCGMDKTVQEIFTDNGNLGNAAPFVKQLYQNPYIYINELNLNDFVDETETTQKTQEGNKSENTGEAQENKSKNSTKGGENKPKTNLTVKANKIFQKHLGENFNINETYLKELLKYLTLKEVIGYYTWILLLGILTILSSFNFLLSHHCSSNNDSNTWMEDLEKDM